MARRRTRTKLFHFLLYKLRPDINCTFNEAVEEILKSYHCKRLTIVEKVRVKEQLYKDYDSLVKTLEDHSICFSN